MPVVLIRSAEINLELMSVTADQDVHIKFPLDQGKSLIAPPRGHLHNCCMSDSTTHPTMSYICIWKSTAFLHSEINGPHLMTMTQAHPEVSNFHDLHSTH